MVVLLSPIFSYTDGPSSIEEYFRIGVSLLATVSFLIPNTWGVKNFVFYIRLIVMCAAAIIAMDMSFQVISGVYGSKPSSIYYIIAPMTFGELTAPLLLVWHRYSFNKHTGGENPHEAAAEQVAAADASSGAR